MSSFVAPIKLERPIFGAVAGEKPMGFLDTVINYLEATDTSDTNFKYFILRGLKGPAIDWWPHIESRCSPEREFWEKFVERFWNRSANIKLKAN